MAKIEELDKNFAAVKVNTNFRYYDLWDLPEITVEGLYPGTYCRMDPRALPQMPKGIQEGAWNTAGGVVRFRTRGRRFGIRMHLRSSDDMSHMPRTGSSGLDIYVGTGEDCRYLQSARPNSGEAYVETECTLPTEQQDVTLYLPLYNGVSSLELGFCAGEMPVAPSDSRRGHVVFYGSSITQGGCASRTGNCYANMLGRMLNCSIYNMGFSGCCKGELEMADYIADMPMDVFVLDYDHNAPDVNHLLKTHLPFIKRILQKRHDLPILIVTRPDFEADLMAPQRREVIRASYLWTQSQGFSAAFLDGQQLFDGPMRDACTVDGCHPNDLGFYRMAMAMYPVLKMLLPKK